MIRSSLARHVRSDPSPEEQIRLRRRAWIEAGLVILDPSEIPDQVDRSLVEGLAVRMYGRRRQ